MEDVMKEEGGREERNNERTEGNDRRKELRGEENWQQEAEEERE